MRRTILAFFGLAFTLYWLSTADLPHEPKETLDPVLPSLVQLPSRGWLKTEAQKIALERPDPAATLKRLKGRAVQLRSTDLMWLKDIAIERASNSDERVLAVYIIGLSDQTAALDLLKQIGRTAVPPTANDRAHSDEIVVRAHALEAVAKRLPASESMRYLNEVLSRTSDPAVARHARYWLRHLG